jgi:hypothetical protein
MHSRKRLVTTLLALFTVLPIAAPLSAQLTGHEHDRNLSGLVTDPGHEPLRGAIVEIQAGEGTPVESYITGEDGRYHFKRLNSEMDYTVWVIFRKRHSKSKSISKFDSKEDKVINFTIESF